MPFDPTQAGQGVIDLPGMPLSPDQTVLANLSGATAFPTYVTLGALAAALGSTSYQGTWNASTNTPTLVSSVGTSGNYYIVSVAGTTNLNGITDWSVGDWAIFNGITGAWQKVEGGATALTVGSTIISGATNGNLLYNNAGLLGQLSQSTFATLGVNSFTNTQTITPTTTGSRGTTQALVTSQYATGTVVGPTSLNLSTIWADDIDATNGGGSDYFVEGFTHVYYFGGGIGGRQGLTSYLYLTGATLAGNDNRNYVAGTFVGTAQANDGGSGTTSVTAKGAMFGLNAVGVANSGAINLYNVSAAELNTAMQTGSSVWAKSILQLAGRNDDAVAGSGINAMLWGYNQDTASVKWTDGIRFDDDGDVSGRFPFNSSSTVLKATSSTGGTIGNGVDFSGVTVSGYAFKSPGFLVDGSGSVTIDGTTILGNAAGDGITFNAGTWTLGNTTILTRAMGTAPAGRTDPLSYFVTFTGNAGGTSDVRGIFQEIVSSGTANIADMRARYTGVRLTESAGTTTVAYGDHIYGWVQGARTLTDWRGLYVHTRNDGGTITRAVNLEIGASVQSQVAAAGGIISTMTGISIGNIGHATLTDTAYGIRINDFTASAHAWGLTSEISASGTINRNLNIIGTAINVIAANLRVGANTDPTVALDVTGAALISSTLGVSGTATVGTSTRLLTLGASGGNYTGTTHRFDDNANDGVVNYQNYGITAAGQGLFELWKYGTGGSVGGNAGLVGFPSTDTWAAAGSRSTKFQVQTVTAGSFGTAFEATAAGIVATGSYTSGTPTSSTAGAWKLGKNVVAAVTPDATQYIAIDIDGAAVKLLRGV